ncbi:hypothetical protein DL768_006756 [Monosporascus sp. mg162]|nr:hypothetical protein DL768_006756 [Monosporascus sp. mg162]
MSGFQIPGLTTLSQPQAASTPSVETSRQDEKEKTETADNMVVDRPETTQESNSAPSTTPNQHQAETDTSDGIDSMAVVQLQSTASEVAPSTTSSEQGEKKMENGGAVATADQNQSAQPPVNLLGDAPPSPPSLTSGLEALLGGLDPTPAEENSQAAQADEMQDGEDGQQENPEWEVDSSPYESSSEESSSSDSDDESEDDKDYPILGPEETARLLMEMEGGSDDDGEGRSKAGGSGGQVRTKNELPEEPVPVPDVRIEPDSEIVELGSVEHIVENTIVIKANTTGEYQVLDSGSVICTENRTVIAAIADLIGSVRQPRYTARFTSQENITEFGLELGSKIFYSPAHATYVFTQALKGEKGTDASNWHDEEAGEDEMEFSDDEKEAEYKRQLKAKRKGGRGGREGAGGRGGAKQEQLNSHPAALKYDDDEDDDGLYKPLARPAGFGQGPPTQSVETGYANGYSNNRGGHRGRGRGGNRGRGSRGGPRGGGGGGYSLPPRGQAPTMPPQHHQQQPPPPQQQQQSYAPPPQQQQFNYPMPPTPQFPFPWPPNMVPPNMVPPPPPPPQFAGQQPNPGMYFNPAFYNAGGQWPGQQGRPGG